MNGVNRTALLLQEQEFYEQVTRLLDAYRKNVAERLVTAVLPKEQIAAVLGSVSSEKKQEIAETKPDPQQSAAVHHLEVNVKFLQHTEEFVGPDLESYGPFAAEAVAKIPQSIAEIFVNEGIAQKLENP